jgi:nitrate reductase cytochrome c-type subunit
MQATMMAKTVMAKTVMAKTVMAKTVMAKTVMAKTVMAKTVMAKTVAAPKVSRVREWQSTSKDSLNRTAEKTKRTLTRNYVSAPPQCKPQITSVSR